MHQTVQNTPLFACAIGSGAPTISIQSGSSTGSIPLPSANTTGNGPSLDSWARLEAIMKVASRTGHSSFYVEKGRQVLGKSANELGRFGFHYSPLESPVGDVATLRAYKPFLISLIILSPALTSLIHPCVICADLIHFGLGHRLSSVCISTLISFFHVSSMRPTGLPFPEYRIEGGGMCNNILPISS